MEIRKDCFGYNPHKENCKVILKEYFSKTKCKGCPFYKTTEQLQRDRDRAAARIRALDADMRIYIATKHKIKGII